MTARAPGARRRAAWLHGWAGLVLGWIMLLIAASGTASVFKGEIGDWMRPEVSARADPIQATTAAIAYLAQAAPKSPNWYITPADARASTTLALYQQPDGEWRTVALDPVNGRPDGIRDTLGGEFLYRLHFELQLPFPWGRMLASAAGMMLLVTLISGIITHKRIFADFFTLRPGKGKRSWLDLHNGLGVFALPFHLMIAFTGILTLVTLTLPWGMTARYGSDTARAFSELAPGFVTRPAAGRAAPAGDVAAMLADARRRFGGGGLGLVSVDNPGDADALLRVARNDADQIGYAAATATYAMASGRPYALYAESRPVKRGFDVLYGLHMGRFAPVLTRWFYFLCGLVLTATVATGLVLWSRSRSDGIVNRIVARLTVGAVTGVPIATAALFWANRLLPPDMPGRSAGEVRSFFLTLLGSVVAALLLSTRRGWIALSALTAALWLLLPVVSALTTGRSLPVSLLRGDWVFAGFDAVSILLGLIAVAIARAATRHASAPALLRRPA